MKPVTLRTIATKAGVSHMTVSLALRNSAKLPQTTRERIRRIAGELGYKANPLVSAWMTHRRSSRPTTDDVTIAYVNCFRNRVIPRQLPTFERFLSGATKRAEELGYRLEEFFLHGSRMTPHRLDAVFRARGIRGVIVSPQESAHGHLRLDWEAYAAATQGYSLVRPNLSRAANDFAGTMALAIRQLRRRGYRRIGLVFKSDVDARGRHLWTGSLMIYQQQISPGDRIPFLEWRSDREIIQAIKKHRPEAIMTVHWTLRDLLREAGLDVPEDIGLLHLDLHPFHGDWSGVNQQIENAGAAAVDLVVERLMTNDLGIPELPKIVLMQGAWRDGSTLRDPCRPAPLPRLNRRAVGSWKTAGIG